MERQQSSKILPVAAMAFVCGHVAGCENTPVHQPTDEEMEKIMNGGKTGNAKRVKAI